MPEELAVDRKAKEEIERPIGRKPRMAVNASIGTEGKPGPAFFCLLAWLDFFLRSGEIGGKNEGLCVYTIKRC